MGVSLMRLLVVKESMHGSLLLQSSWVHVRMGSRVETPILLSVHVHVEAEHLRLAHGAHAGLHGSRRASSMKAGAFIVRAHVQSWLVYVSLRRARVSAINLGTKLLQPKHTPLQSIPHDGCFRQTPARSVGSLLNAAEQLFQIPNSPRVRGKKGTNCVQVRT